MSFFHHDFIFTQIPTGPEYLTRLASGLLPPLESLDNENTTASVAKASESVVIQNRFTEQLGDYDPIPTGAELFEVFVFSSMFSIARHAEYYLTEFPSGEAHDVENPDFMACVHKFLINVGILSCEIGEDPLTRFQDVDLTRAMGLLALLSDRTYITWREIVHTVWAMNPFIAVGYDLALGDWSEIPDAWASAINDLRICDNFLDVCSYDLEGLADRPVASPDFETLLHGVLDAWYHVAASVEDYSVPSEFCEDGAYAHIALKAGSFDVSDPIESDAFDPFYYDRAQLRMVCEITQRVNSGDVAQSQDTDFLAIMLSGDYPQHEIAAAFCKSQAGEACVSYAAHDDHTQGICTVVIKVGGRGVS